MSKMIKMKKSLIFLVILFFSSNLYANSGSFLVLKSAYLYQNRTKSGKKTLTRKRKAYNVTSLHIGSGQSLMFQLEMENNNNVINGTGFIVETETELKELGEAKVKVYTELPKLESDLTNYWLISSNHLSFTGRVESSDDFPKLEWKAVNFKAVVPFKVWIPEWAGIYRPDKDADWLNRTYQLTVDRKLEKNLADKILLGQIEPGFTKEQVRMALGLPVKEQLIENDTKLEWIYYSRKVIFKDDVVLRVL